MRDWFLGVWYGGKPGKSVLLPLSWLFRWLIALRRRLYQAGVLRSTRLPVPVIVVGNVTIGGTGKTPMVLWLASRLKQGGMRPGIVSRGYGGRATHWPQEVGMDSDPLLVGDEPVLLALRSACPVVVAPDRVEAAKALLIEDVNIVVSDDGLQHYALQRDLEIAMVDGMRGLGNGACLPAGPLREPLSRLNRVGFIVINGNAESSAGLRQLEEEESGVPLLRMRLQASDAVPMGGAGNAEPLDSFRGRRVHAVAGIGNPQRFFDLLLDAGIDVIPHPHPDHAALAAPDLDFADDLPVFMTEKDAVKCQHFAPAGCWYVPVQAALAESDAELLLNAIAAKAQDRDTCSQKGFKDRS